MAHWFEYPIKLIPTPIGKTPRTEQPDVFDQAAADMALGSIPKRTLWANADKRCILVSAHNMFLRALNAIYIQAPFVRMKHQKAFCKFIRCLLLGIEAHHQGEEDRFFPSVERMAGILGIMQGNVQQHHAFLEGLKRFHNYIKACLKGKDLFDGDRVISLIDDFGPMFRQHLYDEIDTLLDLRKHGEKRMKKLHKLLEVEGRSITKNTGLIKGIPMVLCCHDRSFEGGIWADFPPFPWILTVFFRYIVFRRHASYWKFAPCNKKGIPNLVPYAQPEA